MAERRLRDGRGPASNQEAFEVADARLLRGGRDIKAAVVTTAAGGTVFLP